MKLVILLSFALMQFVHPMSASEATTAFPLLGRWRAVEYSNRDGHFHKFSQLLEYQFRPGGYWMVSIGELGHPNEVGTGDGYYTFNPPDTYLLTENYGDSRGPTQRVQFRLQGELVLLRLFPRSDKSPHTPIQLIKMRRIKTKTPLSSGSVCCSRAALPASELARINPPADAPAEQRGYSQMAATSAFEIFHTEPLPTAVRSDWNNK